MNLVRNMMMGLAVVSLAFVTGCTTAPQSDEGKDKLRTHVDNAMKQLDESDPSLRDFLNKAYGYVVFPTAGKGGLIVGGAYGHGIVYEQGQMIGYADISQATVGAQIGGQEFTEIIAFENKAALDRFKAGQLKFAANASAVILKSGAAASAKYTDGVAIFVQPKAGAMAEATVGGQSFSYLPK
jgi:lipid-binding SYLF domain-containing protein